MTRSPLFLIVALLVCGCSSPYYPGLWRAHFPTIGPTAPLAGDMRLRFGPVHDSMRVAPDDPMIYLAADLTSTRGSYPTEHQNLGRFHCAFTSLAPLGRATLAATADFFTYDGVYRMQHVQYNPGGPSILRHADVALSGGGLNTIINVVAQVGPVSLGAGHLTLIGLQFGPYSRYSDKYTLGPVVIAIGLHAFAAVDLPFDIQLGGQIGFMTPGPGYGHVTLTWDRITAWGGSGGYSLVEDRWRDNGYAAGVSYRIR